MMAGKAERAETLLSHIVEWGERCARHLDGISRQQFMQDEKTRDAVAKCIEAVGTAAKISCR
jgi:uncharacterized protein with HEPN domain